MADTGLLLRGDLFNIIFIDPVVTREIAIAGAWLSAGTDNGTGGTDVHYLNLAALAKIGKLNDDQGSSDAGLKTSDLPITFDGGLFNQQPEGIIVDENFMLYFAALGFKEVTEDKLTFLDDSFLDLPYLKFLNYLPDVAATAVDITVTWNQGVKAQITNETSGTALGYATTSGSPYVYPVAPAANDIISVAMIDGTFNAAKKQTITI